MMWKELKIYEESKDFSLCVDDEDEDGKVK